MTIREQHPTGHSDLAPSSKDWQPGATGRDEAYSPEKDLWAQTHDKSPSESPTAPETDIDLGDATAGEIQPGTQREGTSWQSREPDPDDPDDKLNQALKDSFPASDPPQPAQPGVTGWDVPKT